MMTLASRAGFVAVIALMTAAGGFGTLAAQAPSAAMQIGATVAPQCRIAVDEATTSDDRSPAVHVVCGRRALRTLRVSSDEGAANRPVAAAGRSVRAGGEIVFVVPYAVATIASRVPSVPSQAAPRQPVTLTLDF